jgi:4-amino-4-deoxy-L-arabinose transferase-like glycosyltransferase
MSDLAVPIGQDEVKSGVHLRASVFPPALFGLVLAAILTRVVLSLLLPRVIKWDEPAYLVLGHNLWSGAGFTTGSSPELHWPPLFPIVAGLFEMALKDFEWASNAVYAISGGLLLLPVFAMARRIFGPQTAWLTAALLALFPALNVSVLYWGSMSEPLYLLLLYSGLAVLLVGLEENSVRMFVAAGVFLGLAYLTRPEAIAYVGLFSIITVIWLGRRTGFRSPALWRSAGAFACAFLIMAAPYVVYLHAHTGQWMVSGKLKLTWEMGNIQGPTEYDRLTNGLDPSGSQVNWRSSERFHGSVLSSMLASPNLLLDRFVRNARGFRTQFFSGIHFWWGLTPFVIVALIRTGDSVRLRHQIFLCMILLVLILTFFPLSFMVRFFAPAFPVLLMWTAKGALDVGAWLRKILKWYRPNLSADYAPAILGWMPASVVLVFLLIATPIAAHSGLDITSFSSKEAGLWLKSHTPTDAGVMAVERAVTMYADRRHIPSPHAEWPDFLKYARANRADYLVINNVEVTKVRPHLAFLLEPGVPELELVCSIDDARLRQNTLIYRFRPHAD